MTSIKYSVLIEPLSAEDGGGYLATVPDLPGCMTDGETPEEALANIPDAISSWMEANQRVEHPVPTPHYLHDQLWARHGL